MRRVPSTFPRDALGAPLETFRNKNLEHRYYQLVAATDSGENLAFSEEMMEVAIYHTNSAQEIRIQFDEAATATSIPIPGGSWHTFSVQCKTVHAYISSGTPVVHVLGVR